VQDARDGEFVPITAERVADEQLPSRHSVSRRLACTSAIPSHPAVGCLEHKVAETRRRALIVVEAQDDIEAAAAVEQPRDDTSKSLDVDAGC
jgi:hypothetical protein